MALNKPKYTLFKNTRYALNGLIEVTQNEKSFRLQLLLFGWGMAVAWFLPLSFVHSCHPQRIPFHPPHRRDHQQRDRAHRRSGDA
jgi:hypothetical protein